MYNIAFNLGDPYNDGHGQYSSYHMVSNYSASEIGKAYKEACKLLKFDFVELVGLEYECDRWIPADLSKILVEYGILLEEDLTGEEGGQLYDEAPKGCFEFDDWEREFVDIYFNIVKLVLPDLDVHCRDLDEDIISSLEGAAYGFFY